MLNFRIIAEKLAYWMAVLHIVLDGLEKVNFGRNAFSCGFAAKPVVAERHLG